ncbi:MAG: hypothetical protein K0S35_3006, partial [Geminicoccaceae bacterium]|nr:hypothetical protein [Geminicoccaceae bacterium]
MTEIGRLFDEAQIAARVESLAQDVVRAVG